MHADRRKKVKESSLKVGDYVLEQAPKDGRLLKPFNLKPYLVTEVKGSMVTVHNAEHTITSP